MVSTGSTLVLPYTDIIIMYVLSMVLYGLEAISNNPFNLKRLEVPNGMLIRNIIGIVKRTAMAECYALKGSLPIEILIDEDAI